MEDLGKEESESLMSIRSAAQKVRGIRRTTYWTEAREELFPKWRSRSLCEPHLFPPLHMFIVVEQVFGTAKGDDLKVARNHR